MAEHDRPWLPPLLAVLPFLPLLTAPRMVDERVLAFEAIKWIGLDPVAPWALPVGGSGTWRPLLTYFYRLDAEAPALVAHGINLGLHAVAAALVHRWLMGRIPKAGALLGACLFAVHPAHVATAGWIGGRADGAMVVCAVGALILLRERAWLAGLAAAAAILFKETGVAVLPMLTLLAWADGSLRRAVPAWLFGLPVFAVSLLLAGVDSGYLPGASWLPMATRWGPPTLLEVFAPFFVPIGVPSVPRDVIGLVLAVPVAAWLAQRLPKRNVRLGGALVLLALLPVVHVLPNDGGQWYLLLPSVGAALVWGSVATRGVWGVVALCFALSGYEALQWRAAALDVAATIEEQRGADPRVAPPRQDSPTWPHRGPSFCCGLPHQLYDEPLLDPPAR